MTAPAHLFRVEKGAPSAEELAAVTAVLLARTQDAPVPAAPVSRSVAGWRRPERARGFDGPRTWHSTGFGHH
ncbi:acyl-CoA carboxylase subunit epsilon [Streptomyces sp. Qhu_M48]|uniref:acyl-CoA carboxylase subunit epsilon n=1 Tax=Streptomyces sp. Qhu_M48 TaxID=3435889 RepID=UPI003F50537A